MELITWIRMERNRGRRGRRRDPQGAAHKYEIDHATGRTSFDRLEIQHFFEVYKELEPGKVVQGAAWADRAAAEAEVETSRKRASEAASH
jgi:inorganic pyrophosphatase